MSITEFFRSHPTTHEEQDHLCRLYEGDEEQYEEFEAWADAHGVDLQARSRFDGLEVELWAWGFVDD